MSRNNKLIYFLVVVIAALLLSSRAWKENPTEQTETPIESDGEALEESQLPPTDKIEEEPQEQGSSLSQRDLSKNKSGVVISRPVDMEQDIPQGNDEPEVNEYGRKMVPEPPLDKKNITAEEEFSEEDENPADYDKVPMPEKNMDLNDYYNKKKRDD